MATETLRPDASGDECSITAETGAGCPDHYQNVDEAVADDLTTCITEGTTSYVRDLYNLPASSGAGTINKITVYFRCMTDNITVGFAKASIKSNSTVTDGVEKSFDAQDTWYNFSQEWATNPADSQAWEWADINALQIGVQLKGYAGYGDYAYCTQVYVVVDYVPSWVGGDVNGVAIATIAKINGIAIADIDKVNGIS